jgi:hypothetical protein
MGRNNHSVGLEGIPILTSVSNYHKWKLAIKTYLSWNGCNDIIDGPIQDPTNYDLQLVSVTTRSREGQMKPEPR